MKSFAQRDESLESFISWLKDIARKWLKEWKQQRVFEADADPSRPKFFVTAAFMYPNSPAHMGHARTYFIADVLARFKRMQGYNVLFPMGFHYTGTPIIAMAERVAEGDEKFIRVLIERYDVPPDIVSKLSDPLFMARYFHKTSKECFDYYGLSIDWRREFTTIDPDFKKFIHWQFRKLQEKGLIERGTHPVGWCPKHEMPVGAHDTKDDVEPEIEEFTVILFKSVDKDFYYPAATLRPETVFGVTNIWVNPDENYVVIRLSDGSRWLVGEKAAERLKYQLDFVIEEKLKGSSLVGDKAVNPVTREVIPVLPASFVDTSFATGVVMSVPAHAPYDAAALEDLKAGRFWPELRDVASGIKPRRIIAAKELGELPAYTALEKYGVSSQLERDKLDEATKLVYSTELSKGRMLDEIAELCPEDIREWVAERIAGKLVRDAREETRALLQKIGAYARIYEIMNRPVYCRCGAEIVVKLLRDQWFINYGDPKWKELARELLERLKLVPREAKAQFEATIDWLRRRACARTRGLGVELPWDKSWIIESLSDSTIYMAFYTVVHKIRGHGIPVDALTEEFWDYVMLGKGDVEEVSRKTGIPVHVLEELRREFTYWYPLDWRVSGKDLIPNHLTFFIFNHAAIFPRELWPRGIIANGWVLLRGGKMSKSRGNIVLLKDLLETWSPDATRLAMALGAEVHQDFEVTDEIFRSAVAFLARLVGLVEKILGKTSTRECSLLADKWLIATFYTVFEEAAKDLDEVRIRSAAVKLFHKLASTLERYLSMVNEPCKDVVELVRDWIKSIAPFTPFIAEELWSKLGGKTLVSKERWPSPKPVDWSALLAFKYVDSLIEDVKNIIRATKIEQPRRLVIYCYPEEGYTALRLAIKGAKLKEIGESLARMGIPKERAFKLAQRILRLSRELDDETKALIERASIDEAKVIRELAQVISRSVGVSQVEAYYVHEPVEDLGGKKSVALPFKPGIYIE